MIIKSARRRKGARRHLPSTVAGVLLVLAGVTLAVAFFASFLRTQATVEAGSVRVVALSLERLAGDDEPFVTALIRNSSPADVRDLTFSLDLGGAEIQFSRSRRSAPDKSGVVAAGSEARIPVAPVSEFLAGLKLKCPGCFYLGSSAVNDMPKQIRADFCRDFVERGLACRMDYGAYPLVLKQQFKVGRAGTSSDQQAVYAYLSSTAKTPYVVPNK